MQTVELCFWLVVLAEKDVPIRVLGRGSAVEHLIDVPQKQAALVFVRASRCSSLRMGKHGHDRVQESNRQRCQGNSDRGLPKLPCRHSP